MFPPPSEKRQVRMVLRDAFFPRLRFSPKLGDVLDPQFPVVDTKMDSRIQREFHRIVHIKLIVLIPCAPVY